MALGQRCLNCAEAVGKAYPYRTWADIMASCDADDTFKSEVLTAVSIHKKEGSIDWPVEHYSRHVQSGYVIETPMLFLTDSQFQDKFGFPPAEANLQFVSLQLDQSGKAVPGILLRQGPEEGTHLKVFNTFMGDVNTLVCDGNAALRPGVAAEVQAHYEASTGKQGKLLQKANTMPHLGDVQSMRVEHLEKLKAQREQKEALAALTVPVPAVKEEGAEGKLEVKEETEESEDEAIDHVAPQSTLPGLQGGKFGQRRQKPQGAGKKDMKIRVRGKTCFAGSSAAPSSAVSQATSAKTAVKAGKKSLAEKYTDKAKEKIAQIDKDIKAGLEGGSVGRDKWGGQETLKALLRHRGECSESVMLKEHIELAEITEACSQQTSQIW